MIRVRYGLSNVELKILQRQKMMDDDDHDDDNDDDGLEVIDIIISERR